MRVWSFVAAAAAVGCAAPSTPTTEDVEQAATVCGQGPTVKGIDVSYYDGDVDWSKVAGDGVQFAFVRVSDGTTYIDSKFEDYWAGTRANGIVHGAYQFFRPAEDPIAQADLLLSKMGAMRADDLPPVIDVEVSGGKSPSQVAAAVQQWVDHVQAAIGRAPIVYTGKYFWEESVDSDAMSNLPLWHAQYTSAECPNIATPWSDWAFWQYTSTGQVDGITAEGVDVDRWNGDYASLQAFLGAPSVVACAALPAAGGIIDDGDACYTGGGPPSFLRGVTTSGYDNDLVWTHTTDSADEANFADWSISVTEAGTYQLEVYTAASFAQSTRADYRVTASGQTTSVTIDQTAADGWQSLGAFAFDTGSGQGVHLGDNTGEPSADNVQLVFDAVRVTRVADGSDGSDGSNYSGPASGLPHDDGGGCTAGGPGGLGAALGSLGALLRRRRRAA